jgi:hypothetical protein
VEQSLLENRKRPIAIAARAIIRAGKGHKYWSSFSEDDTKTIEKFARELHSNLFEPEIKIPIKNLDLPLGGSKGIRTALQVIIEYISISCISQKNNTINIAFGNDDADGSQTISVLKKADMLTNRITGNDKGSLGLHPAIYYYGPSGIHSSSLFLGTAKFISEKLANNDSLFFRKFTERRIRIEKTLIEHKELIATVLQKMGSSKRIDAYSAIISKIYSATVDQTQISDSDIVDWAGLTGKIVVGKEKTSSTAVSDETKSRVFIYTTLKNTAKCPICGGYIDTNKSISYDHITRKVEGGLGNVENIQITHPFCNQSFKH